MDVFTSSRRLLSAPGSFHPRSSRRFLRTCDPRSGLISASPDTFAVPSQLIYFCENVKSRDDDGHLSSDDGRMKLFILASANGRETKSDRANTPRRLRNSFERDRASRTLFTTIISPVDVTRSLPFDVLRGILVEERTAAALGGRGEETRSRKISTINVA